MQKKDTFLKKQEIKMEAHWETPQCGSFEGQALHLKSRFIPTSDLCDFGKLLYLPCYASVSLTVKW